MHYTLKDMVRLTGLNERTVPKYLERYTQRTGSVHVEMHKDGRHWRYSEDDLAAVLAEKAHVEEERTRKAPAEYTQSTDVLARLEAIEQQLAVLKERASYLFVPVTRSAPNLGERSNLDLSPHSQPSESHYSAFHVARSAASTLPEGYVPVDRFAQQHGMRESQRNTWLGAVKKRRLPAKYNREGWLHDTETDGRHVVTRVSYALDAEGRRAFCELWRDTPWFRPCEECPHELVYPVGVEG